MITTLYILSGVLALLVLSGLLWDFIDKKRVRKTEQDLGLEIILWIHLVYTVRTTYFDIWAIFSFRNFNFDLFLLISDKSWWIALYNFCLFLPQFVVRRGRGTDKLGVGRAGSFWEVGAGKESQGRSGIPEWWWEAWEIGENVATLRNISQLKKNKEGEPLREGRKRE